MKNFSTMKNIFVNGKFEMELKLNESEASLFNHLKVVKDKNDKLAFANASVGSGFF